MLTAEIWHLAADWTLHLHVNGIGTTSTYLLRLFVLIDLDFFDNEAFILRER